MTLKNFLNKFGRLFSRRKGSVIEVLATMLAPDELEAVIIASKTQGHITELAAKSLGITEDLLVSNLAHELGIGYSAAVAAVDLDRFPADRSLSQYRRAISIPVFNAQGPFCLIVADPFRSQGLLRQGEALPFVLAKASSIVAALDESERLHKAKLERCERDRLAAEREIGLQALCDMVAEAEQYDSTRLRISFPRSGLSYSFVTADGKEGTGTATDGLREPVFQLILSAFKEGLRLGARTLRISEIVKERDYEIVLKEGISRAQLRTVSAEELGGNVVEVQFGGSRGQAEPQQQVHSMAITTEVPAAERIVLVVDDNQTLASVLERFLGRQGLKAVLADNGEKALAMLQSGAVRPAAIVSDLHMPRMDGAEMLRAIRSMPEFADIPVVMLTSDNEMETEVALLESGADAFVAKNEDPRILCAHVKRLVSRSSRRVA